MAVKGHKYEAVECSSSTTCSLRRCSSFMTGGLGCFNDDLLLQILCSLPLKSAVACKSVCKRWLSLISSHDFVSCFVSRHHRHHQHRNYVLLKAEHQSYFLLNSQIPKFNISYTFLPQLSFKYEILASCDDLLLFCPELAHNDTIYFIGNPFNEGWVQLPPPPPPRSTGQYCFGFTCEEYYKVKGDREQHVIVNSSCRFRVVRLTPTAVTTHWLARATSAFELDIFSSETWQWTTTMMHTPLKIQPIRSIPHNGLLYWMCFFGEVVVHDPFTNTVCYAVHPPQDNLCTVGFRFSVSEGSLLAFQRPVRWGFKVWELEDWDQREWKLKSVFALEDHILNSSEMLEWARGALNSLVFDPSDKNVCFLYTRAGGSATINLRTRVFKPRFLPKLSQQQYIFIMRPNSGMMAQVDHPSVFEIKAPCYPTPISALFNQARA